MVARDRGLRQLRDKECVVVCGMVDGPLKPQFAQFLAAAKDSRRSHLGNVFTAMFVKVVRARTKEPSRPQGPSEEAPSVRPSIQVNGRMDSEP